MLNLSTQNIWLNIDKPIGYSSAKVVAIVKRITKAKKVGHGGTLDPFASGVLPIALNKATKTCDCIMNDVKKYGFTISWGEFRDTDDVEGKVVESSAARPSEIDINNILSKFTGKIKQTPSRFSAIKINGERAYNLARNDVEFEMPMREIEIFSLKLIAAHPDFAEFEVECSKGTYVRSLARDISKSLDVCGYVSKLTRLKVGKFLYEKTISLDKLKQLVEDSESFVDGSLFFLCDVLDMVVITVDDLNSSRFRNGQIVEVNHLSYSSNFKSNSNSSVVMVANSQNETIGLAKLENNFLKPINVF